MAAEAARAAAEAAEADERAKKQEEEEEHRMPTLVVKDRKTKTAWAHVVPPKGVGPYAMRVLARELSLLGHRKWY